MGQTIAQALIQEGRELGYAEATIQTKQEDLITLLQAKFGQLPQGFIERIQTIQTKDRLDTLFRQAIIINVYSNHRPRWSSLVESR